MKVAFRRYFGSVLFAVLLVVSVTLGATGGVLFVYNSELPQVESLEDYRPNVVTEVYGDDGQVIGTFALERRIIIEPAQIPLALTDALVSVEDQNFFQHWDSTSTAYLEQLSRTSWPVESSKAAARSRSNLLKIFSFRHKDNGL